MRKTLIALAATTTFTAPAVAAGHPAFAALPEGTVETLSMEETLDQLGSVLTRRVIAGEGPATDLVAGMTVATAHGPEIMIDPDNGVRVNNARIVAAKRNTSKGVIHMIDKAILPPT